MRPRLFGIPDALRRAQQGNAQGPWRLALWRAEFAQAPVEQAYQSHHQQASAGQLQLALAVWGVCMLAFAASDYLALGRTPAFFALLAMRLVVTSGLLALILAVRRKPSLAAVGRWTTLIELLGFAGFILLYLLRPAITPWAFAMTLLMLVMLFVFVPNRLWHSTVVAVLGALGTLAALYFGPPGLTGYWPSAVLSLAVVLGFVSAWRLQLLQRRQYVLLMRAQEQNRALEQEIQQRQALQEELRVQASIDPLTGLHNRRAYEERFAHELARALRTQQPLSLVMFDLDHFKRVNDTYGHAAGDEVLRRFARLCLDEFRAVDIAGRLGGEEFVVLMPGTTLAQASEVAYRLLRRLADTSIDFEGQQLRVRATAGVAERGTLEDRLESLLARADQALYAGKRAGRSRVAQALSDGSMAFSVVP